MKITKENLKPIIFFSIFALIIILIWFRNGLAFGGGDVGLPTYNPKRVLEIASYIWWEATAPGFVLAQGVISIPFLLFLSIFQSLGFSNLALQIILFFIFIFFMGYGSYLFVLSIIEEKKDSSLSLRSKFLAYIAALFYLLNPYTMIVWHRFLHTSMFFLASIPFYALFWKSWIKQGKASYIFIFLFINLLTVYLFGTIAFALTIGLLMFLISMFEILLPKKDKKSSQSILLRFLIGSVLWLFIHSWWLIPTLLIGQAALSEQHNSGESLVTLINISKQSILPYSLQFVNPFYLYYQAEFGSIYKSLPFLIIPWIGALFVVIGFIYSLTKKEFAKIGLIYFIVFILAKGAASPFGYPFIFAMTHFLQLGVLRNPFEKLGILLPLLTSILFILGIDFLLQFLNKYFKKVNVLFLIFLSLVIYFTFSWPILLGKIFGTPDNPPVVKVPEAYSQADNWISQDVKNQPSSDNWGKIIHLPLTREEAIKYKWDYGYSGLEPSATFFTALPSISRGFNLTRVDDSLTALSLIFHTPYSKNENKILKLLQDFNVRYMVLHKDVIWEGGHIYNPQETEILLENLVFLKKAATFGNLIVYRIEDKYYKPIIDFSGSFNLIYPSISMSVWPWFAKKDEVDFVTPFEKDGNFILDKSLGTFIFPEKSFISSISPIIDYNILISQLVKIKEILNLNGELPSKLLLQKILLANQKLVDNRQTLTRPLLSDYQNLIKSIFEEIKFSRLTLYVNPILLSNLFQYHQFLLSQLGESQLSSYLSEQLIKNGLLPTYKISSPKNSQFYTSRFQIPKQQKYEMLMTNAQVSKIYPEEFARMNIQVNNKLILSVGKVDGENISFGEIELPEGVSELSYEPILSLNLAKEFENKITSVDETMENHSFLEVPLDLVRGDDTYQLNFDIQVQQGNGFYIQLLQDTDSKTQDGKKSLQVNEFVNQDIGDYKNYNLTLPPLRLTTKKASIRIISHPKVLVRNLRIQRLLNNNLFLRSVNNEDKNKEGIGQVLNIERKSPVMFTGELKITKPGLMIFKETYHSGWELKLIMGTKEYPVKKHYLANLYANAWYIDKEGEYNFVLEFTPQRIIKLGFILTAITWIGIFIFMLKNKINYE